MSNAAASPYAAPASNVEDVSANPEAEAIRRAHISHEASIKSVGILYYLGGVLVTIVGIGGLLGTMKSVGGVGAGIALLIVGVAQLFAGWGVRALLRWGRTTGCVLSIIGLLGFPVGTLINGYILYLFFSKKGRTIFSPEYKDVIAVTPHVKHRTSMLVWIFLALLLVLFALAFFTPTK